MHYLFFADDSSDGDFYTVAGYLASIEAWKSFSRKWYSTLKQRPRLGFFRTNDALGLKGQFRGWEREAADARMVHLARHIPHTECVGVASYVSIREFSELFIPNFLRVYRDPYFLCASELISRTCRMIDGPDTRVDFCFDRQGNVGRHFTIAFDAMLGPSLRSRFSCVGDVMYADKARIPPLQAADMHAAWVRRRNATISFSTVADQHLGLIRQYEFPILRSSLQRLVEFKTNHNEEIEEFGAALDRGDWETVDLHMARIRGKS